MTTEELAEKLRAEGDQPIPLFGVPVEVELPWTAPPLNLNQRMHWRTKAALTRQLRDAAAVLARHHHLHGYERVRVTLHYQPRDRRTRDAENPIPTLKALADGLVDAGVVRDDSPDLMVKDMPVIHDPARPPRLWLVVEPLPPLT